MQFALIFTDNGRSSTMPLCRHFNLLPSFRNRFFFIEHSHKSCLKTFNSRSSVSDKFFKWSVMLRGDEFKGIFGVRIRKFWYLFGWAFNKASFRLRMRLETEGMEKNEKSFFRRKFQIRLPINFQFIPVELFRHDGISNRNVDNSQIQRLAHRLKKSRAKRIETK